ncbi:MAG: hypothetical protein ACRDV4_10735 [Acidimicrobiales bacterium]
MHSGKATSSITFMTAGNQTITATSNKALAGTSNPVAVGYPRLTISAPSATSSESPLSFTVSVLNVNGTIDTTYPHQVHFTSDDPMASVPTDSALPSGTKSFSAMLDTAGNETITVTDTSVAAITTTVTITVTDPHLVPSAPSTATSGKSFGLKVSAYNQNGTLDTTYTGTISFSTTAFLSSLPANSTLTDGKGTFNVKLDSTASYTITASDTAVPGITGTSNQVKVS